MRPNSVRGRWRRCRHGLNGRIAWKVKSFGVSYKEWQATQVATPNDDA